MLSADGPQEACSRNRAAAKLLTFECAGATGTAAGADVSFPGSGLNTVNAARPPGTGTRVAVPLRRSFETYCVGNASPVIFICDPCTKPLPLTTIVCRP